MTDIITETTATDNENAFADYLRHAQCVVENVICDVRKLAESFDQSEFSHMHAAAPFVSGDADHLEQAWRQVEWHFAMMVADKADRALAAKADRALAA